MELVNSFTWSFGMGSFGGFLVWVALIAVLLLSVVGVALARWSMSLDAENAPKILTSNPVVDFFSKLLCMDNLHYSDLRGRYSLDCTSSTVTDPKFETREKAIADSRYSKVSGMMVVLCLVGSTLLGFVIDVVIVWLSWDALSAIIILGFFGTLFIIRTLSGFIWNHSGRITKLEEDK